MKLRVKNISLNYGDKTIFKNLSLKLNEGEILAIQGDNGSGKTSLCLALSGNIGDKENVDFSGEIVVDNQEINSLSLKERCLKVGIVFQNPDNHIFSPLVTEELVFAPENLGVSREEIISRLDDALRVCGIEYLKGEKVALLSGGEKQLVALASVLTMKPELLIVDEITSRIDSTNKERVRKILTEYAKSGRSVILVSHSRADIEIADKLLIMERAKDYSLQKNREEI